MYLHRERRSLMPPLTDPERLCCYRNALANWNYDGFVSCNERAWGWLQTTFPAYSRRQIAQLLYRYVHAGGEIDEQVETREEWRDRYEFHHDLRVRIGGRLVYFETRLIYRNPDDPDDPVIVVVNAHDA
jgi:hypothetical protein